MSPAIALVVLSLVINTVITQDEFGEVEDAAGEAPPSPPVRDVGAMAGGGHDNNNTPVRKGSDEKTFAEESILALKQLGVILGQLIYCF